MCQNEDYNNPGCYCKNVEVRTPYTKYKEEWLEIVKLLK